MALETVVLVADRSVRTLAVSECPRCSGEGIARRSRSRGRPRKDAPLLWGFCRNCNGRGWVSGGHKPRNRVTHAERKVLRSVRARCWFARWRDGETLAAIGRSEQPPVSRERVRQLIYEFTPRWEVGLVHQLHAARARLREFERTYTPGYLVECWVCGATFRANGSTSTVVPQCPRHAKLLGMQWQDICNVRGRRDMRRAALAKHRPVEGTGVQYGKRWTNPGSAMHAEVQEAVRDGWPAAMLLPPSVVEQHRKLLDEAQHG